MGLVQSPFRIMDVASVRLAVPVVVLLDFGPVVWTPALRADAVMAGSRALFAVDFAKAGLSLSRCARDLTIRSHSHALPFPGVPPRD